MKMAQTLRVRWGQRAPPELSENPWFATLTAREQDALPLLRAQMPSSIMRDLSQSIFRANAATWKADLKKHVAPTMLPRMNVWLEPAGRVKQARMLLGREALLYQGFPSLLFLQTLRRFQQEAKAAGHVPATSGVQAAAVGSKRAKVSASEKVPARQRHLLLEWCPTESLMQDLAGNAMSLPVVMTMLQRAFASVSWRSKGMKNAAEAPVSTDEARRTVCGLTVFMF